MGNCIKNGDKRDTAQEDIVLDKETKESKKIQELKIESFEMDNAGFYSELNKVQQRQNMGKDTYVKNEMVN